MNHESYKFCLAVSTLLYFTLNVAAQPVMAPTEVPVVVPAVVPAVVPVAAPPVLPPPTGTAIENYTLPQLQQALDWAYMDPWIDGLWLQWADTMIGGVTGGMIGGDNPTRWDKYPEDMTPEEFAALEKLFTDYWGFWPGADAFDSVQDYLFLLWLRRVNGGELDYSYTEQNIYGYTIGQMMAQTTESLNAGLVELVNWSNMLMVDGDDQADWIAVLKAEFKRRKLPVPANSYAP